MMHEEALDLVAVLALGALPAAEAEGVRAHLATCEECRREYAELRASADALAYSAEVPETELSELQSARMKSFVMRETRRPSEEPLRARAMRPPLLAYLATAAAIVVALLSSLNNVALRTENEGQERLIAQMQQVVAAERAAKDASDARVAALTAPGSRHLPVAGGEVIESGGRVFIAVHAASLPPGKVFQAWTVAHGAKGVAPSLTFAPDAHGVALVELPDAAKGLDAVAVTVEPDGGSKAPTSKPLFIRKLG
jgi:anti-sigma-K factor RskA